MQIFSSFKRSAATPATSKAPDPCTHKSNSRNLVVCVDGTSKQFGADVNTNVIELYDLLLKGERNQRTWYNSGIGTYPQSSGKSLTSFIKVLSYKLDSAHARNFEQTVLEAYAWLSDNYKAGDRIFLFGFSRGAFQVRVLSAMIDKVGLIYKGNGAQIPFAYAIYLDPKSDIPLVPGGESQAAGYKRRFTHKHVRVHFVGAWDTVSSIGGMSSDRMPPRTIDGMAHVCYFRHALALDERRVKFLPEYAYGGGARVPAYLQENVDSPLLSKTPHTKEVWFMGRHSDVGGRHATKAGMDCSKPSLRWMVFEAGALGLHTTLFESEHPYNKQVRIKHSLAWHWWFLELLLFTRHDDTKGKTFRPHLGTGRKIHPHQKIHISVVNNDQFKKGYIPRAGSLEVDPDFWNELDPRRLELDMYESTENLVMRVFRDDHKPSLETLRKSVTWGGAQQAVYEAVIEALKLPEPASKSKLLQRTMEILVNKTKLKPFLGTKVRPLLSDLLSSNEIFEQEIARKFLDQFTDPFVMLNGHEGIIWSVAFSRDGKLIASGSDDRTVRIWNAETGKLLKTFQGHADVIKSVVFSSAPYVVSGSKDKTIRRWAVDTREPVGEPFRKHENEVTTVAFLSEGQCIAASGGNEIIVVWEGQERDTLEVRNMVRLEEVPGMITSVTFSSNGKHIASSHNDKTPPYNGKIVIWDVDARESVQILESSGHVACAAISPNADYVVSAEGKNVRLWNVETGDPVGQWIGHDGLVRSVAFSHDGRFVASGSSDYTILIWNVKSDKQEGNPLKGHTNEVTSVAFSNDGTRIISGSKDKTVRVWDVETYVTRTQHVS